MFARGRGRNDLRGVRLRRRRGALQSREHGRRLGERVFVGTRAGPVGRRAAGHSQEGTDDADSTVLDTRDL